jgi:hypothetical protein
MVPSTLKIKRNFFTLVRLKFILITKVCTAELILFKISLRKKLIFRQVSFVKFCKVSVCCYYKTVERNDKFLRNSSF